MKKIFGLSYVLILLFSAQIQAAPKSEYWAFWDHSDEQSHKQINHSDWNDILKRYLVTNDPSGINRFRYGEVSNADSKKLDRYIKKLSKTDPRQYNRREQKAYWLNLYNALTVQLVVKHYPIDSITEIGGLLSRGPWDKTLVKVEGKELSLNDIEHRILRPIWKDHKIHFGLNCASVSCPNLQPVAFSGANVRSLLKSAGKEYINHPRGVHLKKGEMKVSSLFNWYSKDFAKDKKAMMKMFAHYADDRLALYLLGFNGKIKYDYDWSLND
ncbi:MAG: DUF547 domain-containing protein [Pseudomonadales bacterium]|nr:DUF547 domain-containing protein [Pseudomonadales bacterium]MCP5172016.1 DUF547 domain-containing protein [Pseudomonadales bacterium]